MYKFRNKKTQITAAAMALLISAGAVPSYAIEQVGESFVPYSSGRLETTSVGLEILSSEVIATGTVGTGTALWRLYSDGTVIVGGGTIQSEISDLISISPWSEYSEIVTRIIFSEPVFGYFSTVNLFQNLNRLLYIENFHYLDTTRVVHMAGMFHGASSLASLDLSSFDTSNVTNMIGMFREASSLVSLDLSSFDTSNVTNMAGMFEGASSLVSLDLSNFDTSNVTTMEVMFGRTLSLESLDLSSFNTSNVTTMTGMFYGAGSLVSLDLSSFDTSNVESMIAMFSGTTRLSYLDLTSFDTSNVRDMSAMFILSGLKRLDISSFDTRYTRVNNWWGLTNSIFFGMNNLRELVLGEKFVFRGSEGLPMVSNNEVYTGVWRNIGDGTFYNPLGEFLFTSNELMRYYDGIIMADTWVWQPREHVVEEEVEVDKEEEVEADKEEEVEADKEEEVEVDKEEEVEADKEEEVAEDKEEEKEEKEEDEYEVITPQSSNLRVLTINPHNNSNHFFARWFEEWVNGKGGSNQRLSKNINLNPLNSYGAPKITFEQVTTYELSRNPNHKKFVDIEELLRDDQGNYRFDIIAIGSWDFGGILRPGNEPHIIQAVSDFMDAGGAVIFGHDTLTDRHRTSHGRGSTAQTTFGTAHGTLQDGEFYRNRLNRLYGMNYLFAPLAHRAGIIPSQRVDRFAHHSNTANRKFAIITEQGPLTSFPFNFEVGQIIPISATHNNGSLTRGTVWAQFIERHNTGTLTDIISNITGNFRLNPYRNMPTGNTIVNFPGRYITAEEWGSRHANERYAQNNWQAAGTYQSNAFISTYLNTAHIQSWRRVQYLTLEERKLFINTLFYLANISSIN